MSPNPDGKSESTVRPVRLLADGTRLYEKVAPWGPESVGLRRRLRTHYLVTAGLDVPGVPPAIALQAREDGLVLSLPWLSASDLASHIEDRLTPASHALLGLPGIFHIGVQLAEILMALEAKGVAHGAIQAEHVLIDTANNPVSLINFGLARFVRAPAATPDSPAVACTDDLRSLGQLLFWLSTGERTATGRDDQRRSAATSWKPETIAHLPKSFIGIVARLIDAGLPGGYRTAAAAGNDLKACQPPPHNSPLGLLGIPGDLPLPLHRFGRETQ